MFEKRWLWAFAVALANFGSGDAFAQNDFYGEAGGYDVVGIASTRDKPGACVATIEYEGPGETKISLYRTFESSQVDIVYASVTNTEWSAETKKDYNIEYVFDENSYVRKSVGLRLDYLHKGFLAGFPSDEFLDIYAKSASLEIFMDSKKVDSLSLDGSALAIGLFNRCWSWLSRTEKVAQAERDKYKDIPRDPFSKE